MVSPMDSPAGSPAITTNFSCTQCGGELHPDEGQVFLTCPFCGATVYLDKSRVVFHWYLAPVLNEEQATAALYRWMSGSKTVKDLDKKARVSGRSFQFFPLWYFKSQSGQGKEEILLRPAAATSVTELASLRLPPGDLRKYDSALDSQCAEPTVPLETALEWAGAEIASATKSLPGSSRSATKEMAIVHVPLYFFKYDYRGSTFTAVVDAGSGGVLANIFPAKEEVPYRMVGMVTALVYLCLALLPLFGFASGRSSDLSLSLVACVGVGLLVAPILFAWAYWVASKV